ncbi:FG-GAP repeat protein [Polystyrenella longa]|uniref:FG-GAP repeat protein n=1 Tax=Polystyrenella longa TaxID=2528007 RepID=A0A518CGH7_9PLAN|nr:VCBS repeat-containing protein [Polystyrenella longa]QDU78332.1 FG-GAP repeat protein [Polystyrenella longa]
MINFNWLASCFGSNESFQNQSSLRRKTARNLNSSTLEFLEARILLTASPLNQLIDSGQELGDSYAWKVDLGDVDSDGDLDAFQTNNIGDSELWINDGSGNFIISTQVFDSGFVGKFGDIDSDGDLDLIKTGFDPDQETVWFNDGSGNFTKSGQSLKPPKYFSNDLVLGDVDGDGDLDALIGQFEGFGGVKRGVRVLINDGDGNMLDEGQFVGDSPSSGYFYLGLEDLDGDDDLDLIITRLYGQNAVFKNDGTGQFSYWEDLPYTGETEGIALGDIDNDGDVDAIIGRRDDTEVILFNDGTGTFLASSQNLGDPYSTNDVALGDFDNDGDLDLLRVVDDPSSFTNVEKLWWNDGTGFFLPSGQDINIDLPQAVALGDLDQDGDLDAFIGSYLDKPSKVFLNLTEPYDYFQNYELNNSMGLVQSDPGNFTIVDQGDNKLLQTDNSGFTGLSTALLDRDDPLPYSYEMSLEITSVAGLNRQNNGMVIFDYQAPNDFKYVAMLPDQNQWIIGHYIGGFSNRVAELDWDDVGRTIDNQTEYQMHVRVDHQQVFLTVDGETILEGEFSVPLHLGNVGFGSVSAVSHFDDFTVGAIVDTGAPAFLPYFEDLEDRNADFFQFDKESYWSVVEVDGDHVIEVDHQDWNRRFSAFVDFTQPMPDQYQMSAVVTSIEGPGRWHDGFIIFDYQSSSRFKYAGMFAGQNQWVIGSSEFLWGTKLAQVDWDDVGRSIDTNTDYNLHIDVDGDVVTLSVDGEEIVTAEFATGINNGKVGVAAVNAVTHFDDIRIDYEVAKGLPVEIPYEENFDDEEADAFLYNDSKFWDTVPASGGQVLKGDLSDFSGLGVAYVVPDEVLPEEYMVSATVTAEGSLTGWRDGFLIFDYKNEYDFKYAGMFAGQNEWIIGHFQGSFENRLAEVDWDDFSRTINPDQAYELSVKIDGSDVELWVDGENVTSADFGANVNGGPVGVAVMNGVSRFDDFSIGTNPSAIDLVFAQKDAELFD